MPLNALVHKMEKDMTKNRSQRNKGKITTDHVNIGNVQVE